MPQPNRDSREPLLLAGPTGTGKSAAALALAKKIGGEIISVDSMQVYQGLDIGTAKPSREERNAIPHHLLDVVSLRESFDAARFCDLARKAEGEILQRGRVPIYCGGTGLYFKALLNGLGEAPPSDASVRAALESIPTPALLEELKRSDPVLFETIDHLNRRRMVRALEVIRLTGRPFSTQRAAWRGKQSTTCLIGLARAADDLRARIDRRIEQMFRGGLVAETEKLLRDGLAGNRTAMQAIGYRQVVEHLRGERSLAETIALVQVRTRQFAKRQMTWFRRQLPVTWIQVAPQESPEATADRILTAFPKGSL